MTMTKSQESRIRRAFTVQSLTEEERDTCERLAYALCAVAMLVAEVCPACRECDHAIDCLEMALDSARKAVVRYPRETDSDAI